MGVPSYSSPQEPVATTMYYAGTADSFFPDGELIESGRVLIERTVNPHKKTIELRFSYANPHSKSPGSEFIITMKQQASSQGFSVVDSINYIRGSAQHFGHSWIFPEWEFNVNLADGSAVRGRGYILGDRLGNEKVHVNKAGEVMFRVNELTTQISAEQYNQERIQMQFTSVKN